MANTIRNFMNQNSALVTIAAVVILVFSLAFIVYNGSGNRRSTGPIDLWFYDLNTGELFIGQSDQLPPIDAPSGPLDGTADMPAGVKAYVFACNDCGDEDDRFVGYLDTYTREHKEKMEYYRDNPQAYEELNEDEFNSLELGEDHTMVRDVNGETWVSMNSDRGQEIMTRVVAEHPCPAGAKMRSCIPGRK